MDINATGAELYVSQRQSCHGDREGVGATGGAPLRDETGHTWHHPDAQLKAWIMNGKLGFGQMPALQDKLSESEVGAILAYIKTWWSEAQRQAEVPGEVTDAEGLAQFTSLAAGDYILCQRARPPRAKAARPLTRRGGIAPVIV